MDPERVEFLLRAYPMLSALLSSLKAELRALMQRTAEAPDEAIYALATDRRAMDGSPRLPAGNAANPTVRVAETYRRLVHTEFAEARRELANEIIDVSLVLDKIDVALPVLSKRQQAIVRERYWNRKTWPEIASDLRLSVARCREERVHILQILGQVLRIDGELFARVVGKLLSSTTSPAAGSEG